LRRLGAIRRLEGDYAAAQAYLEQSLAICRALGDRSLICRASISLAVLLKNQANYAAARPLLEETLRLARDLGDRGAMANAHTNLAWIDLAEGAYAPGRRHCEAGLAIYREHGSRGAIANMLLALSYFDQAERDFEAARRRLAEALRILQETGDQTGRAACLDGFACLALAQDQIPRAARLWAAAASLRARHHIVRAPADERAFAQYAGAARARVAPAVWDAAWAAGQAQAPDEAVAYALEETQPEAVGSGA
jgi:tetratricopeptide (TPR) repeat protein